MDAPSPEVAAVRQWVERVVVGLNLCPFAAVPLKNGAVRFVASRAQTPEEVLAEILLEVRPIDAGEAETTLIVVPALLDDFDDFLDLAAAADDVLEQMAPHIQLAHFHPDYQFDGAPEDDPANYTNRSPVPVLHLLRRQDVRRAIETHPDTARIPDDNAARLRAMGIEALRALLRP